MPTVNLNKKEVLSLVGKKLSDKELADRIAMLGTDLEYVKGNEIMVEIFPNRPDMLSEEGLARALSSFVGKKTGLRQYKVHPSNYRVVLEASAKKITPHVVAAVVKGLKFTQQQYDSFMNLQEKLCLTHGRRRKKLAIGAYDLTTVQFPIKYTTKPTNFSFRPLDTIGTLSLKEILTHHQKGKEYGHLLESHNKYPVWIDKKDQVLSMPPVVNSEETKITTKTKDIFLEITGTDTFAVEKAMNILLAACADQGGKIYKTNITPSLQPIPMKLSLDYVNKLLGLSLNQQQLQKLLARMGHGYQAGKVLVPAYRADILHPMDLVEDVAIAYGYEHFTPEIPNVSTIGQEVPFNTFKRTVCTTMAGLGYLETNTNHLSNVADQTTKMNYKLPVVSLTNALTVDYNILRAWMLPSLLGVLKANKHYDYPQKLFEAGTVFTNKGEVTRLGCVLSGDVNYTDARQTLDALLANLGLKGAYKEIDHGSFIVGRVARVSVKGKAIAYVGEIHPQVLVNVGLEMPVSCFELNLTELFKLL